MCERGEGGDEREGGYGCVCVREREGGGGGVYVCVREEGGVREGGGRGVYVCEREGGGCMCLSVSVFTFYSQCPKAVCFSVLSSLCLCSCFTDKALKQKIEAWIKERVGHR